MGSQRVCFGAEQAKEKYLLWVLVFKERKYALQLKQQHSQAFHLFLEYKNTTIHDSAVH